MSHNNLRDSHSNGVPQRHKANGGGSVNSLQGGKEIIPERRRKYLAGGSDDHHLSQMEENGDIAAGVPRKNNKMNVHLQPLDHNPSARGSSVPPMGQLAPSNGGHPIF